MPSVVVQTNLANDILIDSDSMNIKCATTLTVNLTGAILAKEILEEGQPVATTIATADFQIWQYDPQKKIFEKQITTVDVAPTEPYQINQTLEVEIDMPGIYVPLVSLYGATDTSDIQMTVEYRCPVTPPPLPQPNPQPRPEARFSPLIGYGIFPLWLLIALGIVAYEERQGRSNANYRL